jgi:hypothetical protein
MRLFASPSLTIASSFWATTVSRGYARSRQRWKVEEWRGLDLDGVRCDGIPKTDIDLQSHLRRDHESEKENPHAAVVLVFADGAHIERVRLKLHAIVSDVHREHLGENRSQVGLAGVPKPQQVDVPRRAMGLPHPDREERRALQHEARSMRRRREPIQQPLVGIRVSTS